MEKLGNADKKRRCTVKRIVLGYYRKIQSEELADIIFKPGDQLKKIFAGFFALWNCDVF